MVCFPGASIRSAKARTPGEVIDGVGQDSDVVIELVPSLDELSQDKPVTGDISDEE